MIFYSPSSSFIVNSVLLCFIDADLPLSIALITAPIAKVPLISPTPINTLLLMSPRGGATNPATNNNNAEIEKKIKKKLFSK